MREPVDIIKYEAANPTPDATALRWTGGSEQTDVAAGQRLELSIWRTLR